MIFSRQSITRVRTASMHANDTQCKGQNNSLGVLGILGTSTHRARQGYELNIELESIRVNHYPVSHSTDPLHLWQILANDAGSERLKKDILDYIVFEKHLSNTYGTWRMHGKIVPSWMPPEEVAAKTYQLPKEQAEPSSNTAVESVAETVPPQTLDQQDTKATASELR